MGCFTRSGLLIYCCKEFAHSTNWSALYIVCSSLPPHLWSSPQYPHQVSAVVPPASHDISPLLPGPLIKNQPIRMFGSYYTLGNMFMALIFIRLLSIAIWLTLGLVVVFVFMYCAVYTCRHQIHCEYQNVVIVDR